MHDGTRRKRVRAAPGVTRLLTDSAAARVHIAARIRRHAWSGAVAEPALFGAPFCFLRGLPLRTSGNYSGRTKRYRGGKISRIVPSALEPVFDDSSFIRMTARFFSIGCKPNAGMAPYELFRTFSTGLLMVFGIGWKQAI